MILAGCQDDKSQQGSQDVTVQPDQNEAGITDIDENVSADDSRQDVEQASDANNDTIPEATAVPEPTPLPMKELSICMAAEPADIYLYGDNSQTAQALRHLIYENLFTNIGYEYQPQALEKLPNLADGDAFVQKATVNAGDRVMDASGAIVTLVEDIEVINSAGETVLFAGEPIEMQRIVVDFVFKPLFWSDGTPVTAADSVFSYNLAASPETPGHKGKTIFTDSYTATGDNSVRWIGLPGFLEDQTYFTNIWAPLPFHQLGEYTPHAMFTVEEAARRPLSSGPFVVVEWTPEAGLVLEKNPHYVRAAEGLPKIERIIIHFNTSEALASGSLPDDCDVFGDQVLSLNDLATITAAGEWEAMIVPGDIFEQISFGVTPVTEYAELRPAWFADERVRQAMTMCTDRQRMVDELTTGNAEISNAYVPASHPLYPPDLTEWPYDPASANALLDEAGFLDFAGDGRRQDVSSGVPMTITLGTNSESALRQRITEIFQENMRDCGIPVERYDLTAGTWYADGPIGRLFGRRFDLAEFAWVSRTVPDCGLFLQENITGPVEFGFGGWRNVNVTGWSDPAYDEACRAALRAMPGGAGYTENHQTALQIFSEELPIIPLLTNEKIAAARPNVVNLQLDSSEQSLLWNVYEWDILDE